VKPILQIVMTRTATRWHWVVEGIDDPDDFVLGDSGDYSNACAEALAAFDDMMKRRAQP
jgi:hypothetical protein